MWDYLKFLCKSTNEHGVHSPYVYQFLTKGIYQFPYKKKYPKSKERLIQSLLYHFQPQNYYSSLKITPYIPDITETKSVCEAEIIIYFEKKSNVELNEMIQKLQTHQILWIVPIKNSSKIIQSIANNSKLILTIDFFYGILISKRNEQRKQTFTLRTFQCFGTFKI